ncbi:MAG: hypothetical protein KDA53_10335 [Hyphomonas sp.]|nr:hypothetical protein [Hyphomonas sp.]
MSKNVVHALAVVAWLAVFPIGTADAYIGPGVGAGVIGTVLGIVGGVLLALFSIIYYPVKRALKKKRQAAASPAEVAAKDPV